MSATPTGFVRGLAIHEGHGMPMREIDTSVVTVGAGLSGDPNGRGARGVTLLAIERWRDVQAAMDHMMPWTVRRANVLVEGLELRDTVGRVCHLGQVELLIRGETVPCGTMESARPGLRAALASDWRGGVYAEVRVGGEIRIGDPVTLA